MVRQSVSCPACGAVLARPGEGCRACGQRRRWDRHRMALLALVAVTELLAAAILLVHGSPAGRPARASGSLGRQLGHPSGPRSTHPRRPARRPGGAPRGAVLGLGAGGTTPPGSGRGVSATFPAPPGPAGQASPGPAAPPPATAAPPAAAGPGPPVLVSAPPPVTCQTNLPLAQAPDAPYNFLCRQGAVPLTWSTSHIVIYLAGLTAVQNAAFLEAVTQWEVEGRFQVSFTSSPQAGNVTVTGAPLSSLQPGYVEDGYASVFYRCASACAYYHAEVVLSSTAGLLQTDWVSTILHELGHVAGLNHVAQSNQIMYPEISPTSPVTYAAGDRQGLAILAAERGA